jgi:hypothetical protein
MDASQNGGSQEEEDIEVDVEMLSDSEDDEEEPPSPIESQETSTSPTPPPPPPPPIPMITEGDEAMMMTTDDDEDYDDDEDELRHSSSENGAILTRPEAAAPNFWATLTPPSYLAGGYSRNSRGDPLSRSLRVFSIALLPNPRPELENGGKSKKINK